MNIIFLFGFISYTIEEAKAMSWVLNVWE